MRYLAPALVLAASIIAPAVAAPSGHHHGHAHLHSKREAAPEPEPVQVEQPVEQRDVDWADVSYTYSAGQQWGTWGSEPVSTPAAQAVNAAAEATTTGSSTPEATSASASASASSSSSGSDSITSIVGEILTTVDEALLTTLGFVSAGINSQSSGDAWIGTDGKWSMEFTNNADEDIIVVVWGSASSWVNTQQPLITYSLASGSNFTASFADSYSGAMSAVYSDTKLVDGQVSETWIELTVGSYTTADISREVNMSGHSMSVVVDECTSSMTQCVFQCPSGNSCMTGYELVNCENGSQPGASYGTYDGSPSGGCTGLTSGGVLYATFEN